MTSSSSSSSFRPLCGNLFYNYILDMTLTKKAMYPRKTKDKKTKKSNTKSNKKSNKIEKHKYYIVHCHDNYENELNGGILEEYLQKLGVMPDNKAMETIEKMDRLEFKNEQKSIQKYCDINTIVKLPRINKVPISADVFIFNRFLRINGRFYNYPKFLVNIFNLENIRKLTNKESIISNIMKIEPEVAKLYIPTTFNIAEKEKYEFPKWYILRPIEGSYGHDIFYVNNEKDLEDKIKYYNTHGNNKIPFKSNVIASEYVSNPLLFNKRKMHLRMYLLVSFIKGVLNTFLRDFAEILTAKEPFDMNEPFTKVKHDTHGESTVADFFYPKDFNSETIGRDINNDTRKQLWNKIRDICKSIGKLFIKNKDKLLYPNEENAYHLLGIDIMIRDDMTPVFIECNYNPGMDTVGKDSYLRIEQDKITNYKSKIIYGWINEVVLEPLFKYNDPYKARKHPTYIKLD